MTPSFWLDESPWARTIRGALGPLEALWRAGVAGRGALYDRGMLRQETPAIPAISVGNLSVGGTGKTPVAAYLASLLRAGGARPGLVLRGYGGDEPLVHARLNPDVPVVVNVDRLEGAREAQGRGCDVVVLDDAFQHRRVRRVVDLVLVASEQWTRVPRTLPGGPLREPPESLARASLVLVTRKSDDVERATMVQHAIAQYTDAPIGRAHLRPGELRGAGTGLQTLPLEELRGRRVLAIGGIGAPDAFARQLAQLGANVDLAAFRDHHAFGAADVSALDRRAQSAELVVCTLKDAVKLAALWTRVDKPLWYVSQRIDLEVGASALDSELRRLLDARMVVPTSTAG